MLSPSHSRVSQGYLNYKELGSRLNRCFAGRISNSVIRQDHAILLGYATLTQPTNNRFHPLPRVTPKSLTPYFRALFPLRQSALLQQLYDLPMSPKNRQAYLGSL